MLDDRRPEHDRRLVARAPVQGAQLTWRPLVARKPFSLDRPPGVAGLIDLSVTGAGIRAAADARIGVGTRVIVEVPGGGGVVLVRRVDNGAQPNETIYGVEFLQKDDQLTQLINDTLAAEHPREVIRRWKHVR
jgi:hypothetical protein